MTNPTIDRIRVYAYASAPHQHPWDGEMAGGATTITFLRLTASDGSEGVSAAMSAMTLSQPASRRPSRRSRKVPPAQRRISATAARSATTAVQLCRTGKPETGWSRAANIVPVARA